MLRDKIPISKRHSSFLTCRDWFLMLRSFIIIIRVITTHIKCKSNRFIDHIKSLVRTSKLWMMMAFSHDRPLFLKSFFRKRKIFYFELHRRNKVRFINEDRNVIFILNGCFYFCQNKLQLGSQGAQKIWQKNLHIWIDICRNYWKKETNIQYSDFVI